MRLAALLVLTLALPAAPARAASPLVTPALPPSATGQLTCWVVNTSESKTLEIEIEIRRFSGEIAESATGSVEPGAANALSTDDGLARFCVVRVIRGRKRNALVSLVAHEGGAPTAVVQAR